MSMWPGHPVIYETNTWAWLGDLSRKYQRPLNLGTVPADESYDRSGKEMRDAGLYVELGPWKCQYFECVPCDQP